MLAPAEELLDELNSVYHRVAFAPPMSTRRLNGLLNREFTLWDIRLGQAADELTALKKLADRVGSPVVLDTSALMQGKSFLTFDWHSLDPALAGGQVRLVVPLIVVEELDDLLHDRDGARRQKARTVTRALWELHRDKPTEPSPLPDRPGVTIEVLPEGDWHQRRPDNDAEIIDQALMLYELTGRAVFLASCDLRQLYRAAVPGLPAILMPPRRRNMTCRHDC